MAAHSLDARGLQCPLPVLRANKMLRRLAVGDELEVFATDAAAPADFASFCKTTGHALVACHERDGAYVIVVRKAGAAG